MKISTLLDHIDSGHMALPEFQRGYVWNRDQVKGLFDSLYKRHPVGGLLVWATESSSAQFRGDGSLAPGVVKLLLDGQQRITSLYGVARGRPPKFFDGNAQAFTGLYFHLGTETFGFYQPLKMKEDLLWIDVTDLLCSGTAGLGVLLGKFSADSSLAAKVGEYAATLTRLTSILDIELHVEEVTGLDKSLDVVVEIFNKLNSGGTKLSKGDLALAKICADWPEARNTMKGHLANWRKNDFDFDLDWLLRCVNTAVTGEAKFLFLHDKTAEEIQNGLKTAVRHIDTSLNLISGRLGLDHSQVFFGRFGIPVMVHYLNTRQGQMDEKERDKLLFWYLQAGMWGRFSGSTETFIDKDLEALQGTEGGLDKLLEQLRLWHGGLRVEAGHFSGWSIGARFYSVLYILTRMGAALDWGTGLPLKASLLGKMNRLEVHHIFPKARLKKLRYSKQQINALANFCFLTKETNLKITDHLPEEYFPEVEKRFPGALASQWIPVDPNLWKAENYPDFVEARKELLAAEMNRRLEELLHGELKWLEGASSPTTQNPQAILGGIHSEDEEEMLEKLNAWVEANGFPRGQISFELTGNESQSGDPVALVDLAWPRGLQEELSQPIAVLINEEPETVALISQAGYKCFTSAGDFADYFKREVLTEPVVGSEV